MLLCPANTLSNPAPDKSSEPTVLPIEEVNMPEENVCDLKDVFDAINKLCDTMKSSSSYETYDERDEEELNTNIVGSEADPNIIAEIHPSVITSQYDLRTSNSQMVISVSEVDYDTSVISECDTSTLVASENDSTMIASTIDTSMLASEIFSSMLASQNDYIAQEIPETDTDVTVVEYSMHKENVDSNKDLQKESTKKAPAVLHENEEIVAQSIQELPQSLYTDLHQEKAHLDEEVIAQKVQEVNERWSDAMSHISNATVTSDTGTAQCEAGSEVYYTASSEVSLLSDTELPDKPHEDKDGNYVIAGHVAAMRERFESMTRTNTPCPDLIRSLSPSLELFRNTSPSPDRMA